MTTTFESDVEFDLLTDAVEQVAVDGVLNSAKSVLRDAESTAPRGKTGKLAKSGEVREFEKKNEIVATYVNFNVYYAKFVELGTPGTGRDAKPFLRNALRKNHQKIKDAFTGKV